ncbi:hypothetical protein TrLO_g110 [Triparma laevis f. longispina]|nr:hypothetical protein TrLO_g110 [Triparma laevis f. longispina]
MNEHKGALNTRRHIEKLKVETSPTEVLANTLKNDNVVKELIEKERAAQKLKIQEDGDFEENSKERSAMRDSIRFKSDVEGVKFHRKGKESDETRNGNATGTEKSERRQTAHLHWKVASQAAHLARMVARPIAVATQRVRGRSNSSADADDIPDSHDAGDVDDRSATIKWARKASNFVKRKSIADVHVAVKKQQEFEELKSSVGQFRNPVFDNSISRSSGVTHSQTKSLRLRAGIYGSRTRMRKGSIVPEDIMEINRVRRSREGEEVMDVVITPQEKRRPENMSDWVWDRDSHTYQRWYLMQIFLIILEACILPYQFVFWEKGGTVDAPYFWTVIHFFISLFYIADFYFSFHLTYVDKKSEVVIDLDLIRKNYVGCLRFYLDIVAALPFDFVRLFTVVWWWASYVKLVKSFRLLQVMRLKRLSDNQTVVNLGRIAWVLVIFVVVMHIMACMWFQLSVYEEKILSNNHSWMRQRFQDIAETTKLNEGHSEEEIQDMTLEDYSCGIGQGGLSLISNAECFTQFRQYLVSLYAVMLILMQDGIDPTTEIECLFSIVFGLFGMVVGAVLVGQTADIIGNLHRAESRYRNKLDDVTEQLKNLDIDSKTRRRVFEYLDFIWTVNKGLNRESILGELSDNLRNEVLVSVHGEVIRKIPLFDIDEIPELLVHVVSLLKSSYYLPGDVIVHEHEKTVDTSCMYFIVHGNVAVYHMKQPEDILHMMTKGDFFGEIAYLARGARRTASLCAASNSDVASLRFTDVDYLTKLFPEMKSRMESELKKHMAFTVEGKKYLEAEMNMGKVALGSIVFHQNRGEGIVVYIDEHKRRHVQFKDGDVHKYLPTSWHKMKLLKMGESPRNVWKERGKSESRRRGSLVSLLTPLGSREKEEAKKAEELKEAEGGSQKHLKALRDFAKHTILDSPNKEQGEEGGDGRKHGSGRKHNSFKFAARFLAGHHRNSKNEKKDGGEKKDRGVEMSKTAPSPLKLGK